MKNRFASILKISLVLSSALVPAAAQLKNGAPYPALDPAAIALVQDTYGKLSATQKQNTCSANANANADASAIAAQNAYCQAVRNLLDPRRGGNEVAFATLILQENAVSASPLALQDASVFGSFLAQAAAQRLDVQNSSPANASGSSTTAERAGISDVLGVALDAGAVTQSVSGSALTLQGNALSLVRFLNPQAQIFNFCADAGSCDTGLDKFLNGLSGSATLSLSNTSTQTVAGTVAAPSSSTPTPVSASALIQNSSSHLTGFSIRYQIFNHLDLRSSSYKTAWTKAFSDPTLIANGVKFNNAGATFDFLSRQTNAVNSGAYEAAKEALETQLRTAGTLNNPQQIVGNLWQGVIDDATKNKLIDLTAVRNFLLAGNSFFAVRQAALNTARQQAAAGLTLEYDYSRLPNQPQLSTAKLAYTWHPGVFSADAASPSTTPKSTTRATAAAPKKSVAPVESTGSVNDSAISFNIGADFYNTPPASTGAFRDFQAALQIDHHFGNVIATLAAYDQYQIQAAAIQIGSGDLVPNTNIVLPAAGATLLAPKGNIVIAQAMVTFPLKSGTNLPVGITWSNRTELIKANEVRGHVGFNFDWSSLIAGSKSNQ